MPKTPRTIISAYGIVHKNGHYLLTQDVGKPGYKLPGGKLEPGETIIEALKREIQEETGFQVKINQLIHTHEYVNKKGIHRQRYYYTGQIINGQEKPQLGEVLQIRWFTQPQLQKLKESDFYLPTYFQAIQKFLSRAHYLKI